MKKFIIDSNILIEYFKGNNNAKNIIDLILNDKINKYLLSIDTLEEILYILVRYFSKKSYWELKNKPDLARSSYNILIPLVDIMIKKLFYLIDTPATIKDKLFTLCKELGILPKDALIIALAIENKVNFIISLDKDFKKVSPIKVINSADELKKEIINFD